MGILAAKPEDQIVITKQVGMSGTLAIVREKGQELAARYSQDFLEPVLDYQQQFQYEQEYKVLEKCSGNALVQASFGGIYGALFQLGYDSDLGVMVDLTRIPITQQTIEVTEFYQLNPYLLHADGAMVIACPDGERMVWELHKAGVAACVAGHMTKEKARIVYLGEECRYLTPPRKDEIFLCLQDTKYRKQFPKQIVEK